MKKTATIILALSLTGCVTMLDDNANPGAFSPKPLFLSNLPQGDDSYSIGFRSGCYNFLGQVGYGLNRMYDVSYDATYIGDRLYNQGYKNGDRYCSVFVNRDIIL